jgi:methylenetetrahydrofolate dehydrogenase (NADP+) / methenyltetrahydrofolate cyclohydrolase
MAAIILDGKKLAARIESSIQEKVSKLQTIVGRAPGLGVILVGDNPASHVYVANKEKFAARCGFKTFDARLSKDASQSEVAAAIQSFNVNKNVDGILLQLPLPAHLNSNALLDLIDPKKDADGLHPVNQGLLMRGEGVLRSCTPLGSMRLIDLALSGKYSGLDNLNYFDLPYVDLSGKNAVVVGRSILVGKPLSLMLLERNATVTIAHSKTPNLEAIASKADILVAAIGKVEILNSSHIKTGAIVVDVGINRTADGKLKGDVNFAEAAGKAGYITPVPGGVGPMTIAMLIENTLRSYQSTNNI